MITIQKADPQRLFDHPVLCRILKMS